MGGGERLFSFQNTIYPSYRKGNSNNTYLTHKFGFGLFLGFFWFLFVCLFFSILQSLKRRWTKMNILSPKKFHSWHAKSSSRNGWIFQGSLDMCHSKRSHFPVSSVLEGKHLRSFSFREKGLLPFPTQSPNLYVCTHTAPAQTESRLFIQPWGLRPQTNCHIPQKGIKSMMMFEVDYYGLK